MLVFHYLDMGADLDEAYVDAQTRQLGTDVVEMWHAARQAARRQAALLEESDLER